MKLKQVGDIWHVFYRTERGMKSTSTKKTEFVEATRVVEAAKIQQIELAAEANLLSDSVIATIRMEKNQTIHDAYKAWAVWLKKKARSQKTYRNMVQDVSQFLGNIDPKVIAKDISHTDINDHINNPKKPWKLGTRKLKLSCIRQFFKWLHDSGAVTTNASLLAFVDYNILSHEQKETKQRKIVPKDKFNELTTLLISLRNPFYYAAALISRHTGLRMGDICRLEWNSFEDGKMVVWTDKSNRRVSHDISGEITAALHLVQSSRSKSELSIKHVFPKERMAYEDNRTRSTFSMRFKSFFKKIGLPDHSFHDLRATYASEASAKGVKLAELAKSLGHSTSPKAVRVTKGYVKAVEDPKAAEKIMNVDGSVMIVSKSPSATPDTVNGDNYHTF